MTFSWTVGLLLVAGLLFGAATWRARRPRVAFEVPLLPYGAVQFVSLLVVMLMLAHLVTLLTGHPFAGRMGN